MCSVQAPRNCTDVDALSQKAVQDRAMSAIMLTDSLRGTTFQAENLPPLEQGETLSKELSPWSPSIVWGGFGSVLLAQP